MKSYDFEYDGIRLSSFGYTICDFDNNNINTVSNGSEITFNTVSTLNGSKWEFSNSTYEECLSATFQICKDPCIGEISEISVGDIRDISSWLNRKEFHKFKLLEEEYLPLYFESSFNISRIEFDGNTYGLELNMITNRPYALQEPQTIIINNTNINEKHSFLSMSDEEGFIYPNTQIEIKEGGNLSIFNSLEERTTLINNCVAGEIITMNYPIIETSMSSHKIQNDFNWEFLRIANTYEDSKNTLSVSLPCIIKMVYSPVAKVGI